MAVDGWTFAWTSLLLVLLAPSLLVLRALARNDGHRRDERLISASAILGRGIVMVLLMRLEMIGAGWRETIPSLTIVASFVLVTLGQAQSMVRFGPRATLRLPTDLRLRQEMRTMRAPELESVGQ